MTSLHLLVADLRHAELCVLRGKVCGATVPGSCLPEAAGALLAPSRSSNTNPSHCCYHQDDPLIQSP